MNNALAPTAVMSDTVRDVVGALALGFAVGGVAAQSATGATVTPELLLAAAGLGGGRAAWLIARGK